jgi:prevent-host-death family protein
MTITVSISQFRQNLSDYIARAQKGHTVILKDKKRGRSLIQLVTRKEFNPQSFADSLKNTAGIFTTENHPEWKTKEKVVGWLKQQRNQSERSF